MKAIALKMVEVAKECAYVQKSKRNKDQSYNYAPAAAVLDKINDSLTKHKIATETKAEILSIDGLQTKNGSIMQRVIAKVTVKLVDADSGECLTFEGMGAGADSGDKAVMKAQTAAIKYAYMVGLNIETGDDPEADEDIDKVTRFEQGTKPPAQSVTQVKKVVNGLADAEQLTAIKKLAQAKKIGLGEILAPYEKTVLEDLIFEEAAEVIATLNKTKKPAS